MTKTHTGRAGEFYVVSMLLRLGLNAMSISVDSGVDVIAHKFNDYGDSVVYNYQVKSTQNTTAKFTLSLEKFRRMLATRVNLVVVFWFDLYTPKAILLPPSLLYMLTSGGFQDPNAPILVTKDKYHFSIEYVDSNNIFLKNRFNNVAAMCNRFDRAEDTSCDLFEIPRYAEWADDSKTLVNLTSDSFADNTLYCTD